MTERFLSLVVASGVALLPIFVAGSLGHLEPILIAPLFVPHLWYLLRTNVVASRSLFEGLDQRQTVLGIALTVSIIAILLAFALLPVTARDALIHHLAVPKWWLENGSTKPIEWYAVSYYPMLAQLAYLPILEALSAKFTAIYQILYLLPFAASCAVLTKTIGARRPLPSWAPAVAGLIAISLPAVFRQASEPLVDLQLALFCAVGVIALLDSTIRVSTAGIALGLALSVKLNALPFVALALLAAPLARVSFKRVLVCAMLAGSIASPWFIRNYFATGNPLYPIGTVQSGASSLESRGFIYGESTLEILATPVTMLLFGADEDPRRFDGVLSPLLLLAALGVWRFRHDRRVVFIAVLACSFFVVAQLGSGARIRYLLPILPAGIALATAGLSHLPRHLVTALLVGHLGWFAFYITKRAERLDLVTYYQSAEPDSAYLARMLPEYRFIESVAARIDKHDGVYLVLTGNRFFYLPFKARSGGYLSGPEFLAWLMNDRAEAELKQRNCTYVLMNRKLFERLIPPKDTGTVTDRLNRAFTSIATDKDLVLLKVRS
jgi:hypothetical protein